ncbi:MAG: flagellar basal body rod protein FlgC [Alphaproteobacteria bacterium]|nr:flagellar basal body rod protein FlgC [Alphaproteobacteria bacterium]NDC56173.1 flagellar basal body rod protein FlgC [Alphaproteobacteria bacterium]NDG04520.1 flagellar basal body rod protein FlgC [Alphaproteobacteria bacterium]
MSGDLSTTMNIATSGLKAQGARMKVIAENLANANSTATTPGGEPYKRQVITFRSEFDRALGANKVSVAGIKTDNSQFNRRFDPSHPAADPQGYVLVSNVKPLIETLDMREAQKNFDANISVIEASRSMMLRTLDLLRQ